MSIVKKAISTQGVDLAGLHCHIGSQIFDIEPFSDAASIMVKFIADIKAECGYEIRELNLGGGLGVKPDESMSKDLESVVIGCRLTTNHGYGKINMFLVW